MSRKTTLSPAFLKFAKYLVLLLLLILPLPSLIKPGEITKPIHLDLSRREASLLPSPVNPFFVAQDKEVFTLENGSSYQLGFQQQLFMIREEAGRVLMMDRRGRRGWVAQAALTENFTQNIEYPQEGAIYEGVSGKRLDRLPVTKGVYLPTTALNETMTETLENLRKQGVNTLVFDYKDDQEHYLLPSETAKKVLGDVQVSFSDSEKFMKDTEGFYRIARIHCFDSPLYAGKYPDRSYRDAAGKPLMIDGVYWASPHDKELWDYLAKVVREAFDHGFEEVQLVYLRFPVFDIEHREAVESTEGKSATLQHFVRQLRSQLRGYSQPISAEINGWSATALDDMNNGQHWEALSQMVDFLSPTLFPGQFSAGNFGLDDPSAKPYETTQAVLQDALNRNANLREPALLRPWIQDFNWGEKGAEKAADQIRALKERGIEDILLWNPEGNYHLEVFQ